MSKIPHFALYLAVATILAGAAPSAAPRQLARLDLPEATREVIAEALVTAGSNAAELLAALERCPAAHREAMAFLIANMPERDLRDLTADFLLEDVALAYEARDLAPWGRDLPEEVFLNDLLPYAHLNENRDAWRRDFFDRFRPLVKDCATPEEALLVLNREIFPTLGVQYHATKRQKPDQSPYESIDVGYASCTGLSILLADACRAVGVPARVAGTPKWTMQEGNHTWVEIWDGEWRYVGAAEPGDLDRTWFSDMAARANPDSVHTRVYAASFRREPAWFPLIWDESIRYVRARDVTPFYTHRREVQVKLLDRPGGNPAEGWVTLLQGDIPVAHVRVNGEVTLVLAAGQSYTTRVQSVEGVEVSRSEIEVPDTESPLVTLTLGGTR